jgi:hypothetical protein
MIMQRWRIATLAALGMASAAVLSSSPASAAPLSAAGWQVGEASQGLITDVKSRRVYVHPYRHSPRYGYYRGPRHGYYARPRVARPYGWQERRGFSSFGYGYGPPGGPGSSAREGF